jgi:hypothetical protein
VTKREQIAAFIEKNVDWPRANAFFREVPLPWAQSEFIYASTSQQTRPTAEVLAAEFVENSEFLALRLGTLLGTPQGEIVAQGVEMVSPPFYREDVELLVDALQMAAKMQNKKIAGRLALGAIIATVALILLASSNTDQVS